MSNLKQLRVRIKSIKSTQKITKAMQIVSATKFTKIRSQINDSGDYIEILQNIMIHVVSGNNLQDMSREEKKFFLAESDKPYLLIIVTSERGLCGAFNFMILKRVKSDIANLQNAGKQVKLIIIGKKGYDALKGQYSEYIESYFELPKTYNVDLSINIKEKLLKMAENSKFGTCHLYFNKCKNAMVQIPTKKQILPIEKQVKLEESKYLNYQYEGNQLIFQIINLYLTANINYALLQSRAGEEGARMTAMDNATKNASEIIHNLTLKLNRSRQELITRDLIEIIAGAEAL